MTSNRPTSSPFFVILAAVLILTLTSGGTVMTLATRPTLTEQQERIFDSAIAVWTMGTTTLIGLLNSHPPGNSHNKTNHDD